MLVNLLTFAAYASAALLLGLLAVQAGLIVRFVGLLRNAVVPRVADDRCPPALVVLCLRGADPFLRRCLDALLALDYPRYRVRIVVDSPEDPAWAFVESLLAERGGAANVDVRVRQTLHPTCGLKCNSLLDAVADVGPEIEIVAQLDADVIPHRTWLRELAAPLADPQVGIACGNRWYVPGGTVGSVFRYLWNAPAVVVMQWSCIAWGGSLAIRSALLRELNLTDLWTRTLCEDTPLEHVLRKAKLRMQFVPSLLMLNRESCTLRGIVPWIRRQLLIVRLHHPAWTMVFAHGIGGSAAVLFAAASAVGAFAAGLPTPIVALPIAAIVANFGVLSLLLWQLESGVAGIMAQRGEPVSASPAATAARAALLIPFTQLLYSCIVASVPLARRIEWRGVSYAVEGDGVRLIEYRPYRAASAPAAANASL